MFIYMGPLRCPYSSFTPTWTAFHYTNKTLSGPLYTVIRPFYPRGPTPAPLACSAHEISMTQRHSLPPPPGDGRPWYEDRLPGTCSDVILSKPSLWAISASSTCMLLLMCSISCRRVVYAQSVVLVLNVMTLVFCQYTDSTTVCCMIMTDDSSLC